MIVCLAVLFCSFAYMHHYMLRGWVSHDEGTLAQTAVRVLRGELPHRDFDDVYTGGLAMLDALALRAFGLSLASFRTMLLVFSLFWCGAVYYCAARFLRPIAAAAATLLAVFWGPPNYFSALPSWYNTFFATFGLVALFRYMDFRRRRWLFVAGACGGLSILFKITGLYFVAAAGLWIIVNSSRSRVHSVPDLNRASQIAIVALALLLYGLFLLSLAAGHWAISHLVVFFLPAAVAGFYAGRIGLRDGKSEVSWDLSGLTAAVSVFVCGTAAPILAFLIPYFLKGGLRALFYGLLVEPAKRFQFAFLRPVHMQFALPSLALVILLVWLLYGRSAVRPRLAWLAGFVLLAGLIVGSAWNVVFYRILWMAIYLAVPFLIVLAAYRTSGSRQNERRDHRAKLLLLALVTGMCALVQFPFSAPIYFCYVAPLGVLLAAALVRSKSISNRVTSGLLAVALLIYAVWQVGPLFIYNLGWQNQAYESNYVMQNPRAGGIRVPAQEGEVYDRVADVVREHARGEYIFATPDCPEMYFLTDHRNPTRTMYDFFDTAGHRNARLMAMLERDRINLVVLNSQPEFSNPITPQLMANLVRDYPQHQVVGKFDVRWRP